MRRVLPIIFAASLAAAFASASAQTAPATPAAPATTATAPADATTPPATNNDDIVSCRYEKTTGSLFSKRICHTQREWRQMTEDSRGLMDNIDAHQRMGNGLGDSH